MSVLYIAGYPVRFRVAVEVFRLRSIMLKLELLCHLTMPLLCHFTMPFKVIICLPLSELSEVTTGVSLVKVTEGINEEPVVADGLIQCRGDRI